MEYLCTICTSAFRWVKQMKMIWTLGVDAKSMCSTPLASSSHVIPYHHLRLLVLPAGFSSTKDRLIRVSQVAASMFWCVATTESPICLWLLSVTYTITQLLPVIKATLLFLGHFILLLLFFVFLLLLCVFLQSSTCPPPTATYIWDCIMKSSDYFWNPPWLYALYACTQLFSNKLNISHIFMNIYRHICKHALDYMDISACILMHVCFNLQNLKTYVWQNHKL